MRCANNTVSIPAISTYLRRPVVPCTIETARVLIPSHSAIARSIAAFARPSMARSRTATTSIPSRTVIDAIFFPGLASMVTRKGIAVLRGRRAG
jgi:hypothetical protein